MAKILYKLGLAAYDHRKKFIAAWIAILVAIGILMTSFMGTLSNTFTLPGTDTQRVLTLVRNNIPELSGGTATAVFQTIDRTPFTAEQEKKISQATSILGKQAPVRSSIDPFKMQEQLDSAAAQISDGEKSIAENEQKLSDGQAKIHDGEKQLAKAKKQLTDGEAALAENEEKLSNGRAQLEASRPELTAARQQLTQAQAQISAGERKLADGRAKLAEGEKRYSDSKEKINQGISQLTSSLGASNLSQVPAAIQAGEQQANAAVEKIATSLGFPPQTPADTLLAQLTNQLTQLEQQKSQLEAAGLTGSDAYQKVSQGIQHVQTAIAGIRQAQEALAHLAAASDSYTTLRAAEQQLEASRPQLDAARAEVEAGQAELNAAKEQYASGLQKYQNGEATFRVNEGLITNGEKELSQGRKELEDGRKLIEENTAKLNEAKTQLIHGEKELADGKETLQLGKRMAALTQKMRFVNASRTTAISHIVFHGQTYALTEEQRADLNSIKPALEEAGVATYFSSEITQDLNSIVGITELLGFILAGVVLMIMLGTVVAAGLPLFVALFGVALGVGGTLALSSVIDMQSITPVLALMLGLAVGIDYSLFIVHRHRTQLIAGMPIRESVARAIGTSGTAVFFAGLTVMIALAALVVSDLPFLFILGFSAAFTVLIAVLLSISLTPALLAVIGERLLPKKARRRRAEAQAALNSEQSNGGVISVAKSAGARKNPSLWWVTTLTKKPWLSALLCVIVLGICATPALHMQTALPDGATEPYGSQAQKAYEITSDEFGAGYNGQLLSLVKIPETQRTKNGSEQTLISVAERFMQMKGIVAAVPAAYSANYEYGVLQLIPSSGPAEITTRNLVKDLRTDIPKFEISTGTTIDITGQSAAMIDISERIAAVLPPYLTIVVGLSLILLLFVFRSIVVPLLASIGFLLSLAAAFGSATAVYQWGWLGWIFDVHVPAPLMSFLPILLTGILFGLAMDYQVFVVSSICEAYSHGSPARRAVKEGFNLAAPVVVAAALIMVSVFAAFIFAKLTMVRSLGFALAAGVAFDAFIVRMSLTPALMYLLGDKAWYLPKWLDKILPNVDVEGTNLTLQQALHQPSQPSRHISDEIFSNSSSSVSTRREEV